MTVDDDKDENRVQGIVLLTDEARQYLNPREEIAYQEHRRELAEWMLNLGKNPKKVEGYSYYTVKSRVNKLDLFYRWVWGNKKTVHPRHNYRSRRRLDAPPRQTRPQRKYKMPLPEDGADRFRKSSVV